jgi:hypothetical protein
MDGRVRSVNRILKAHDKDLFARRDGKGTIHIYRVKPRIESFMHNGVRYSYSVRGEDYVISLTDNWYYDGSPREWGLEPLQRKILQMDSWTNVGGFDRFAESRERHEKDQQRMRRNEVHARALDMRKDFARATNDYVVRS